MTDFINSSMSSSLRNVTNETCSFSTVMPLTEKVGKTTAYAVLMLVSLVGNFLVMAIVSGTTQMHTTTNLLIANMAASDFMMTLCAPPRIIAEIFSEPRRWLIEGTFGLLLCKLVYFFQDVSTAVSIQSLVVISVDRFCAIVFPYRALMKTKFCGKFFIPVIWLVGGAIHSVYFYVVKLSDVDETTYCDFSWEPAFDNRKAQESYYVVILILLIILPLLIVIILHCLMVAEVCKSNTVKSRRLWNQYRQRQNSEVMKKVLVITFAFMICLIPINVCAILFYFVWDWSFPCRIDAAMVFFVMRFILFANACINPCLCFILYKRYRRGVKNVFKRLRRVMFKRRRKNRHSPTQANRQGRVSEDAM